MCAEGPETDGAVVTRGTHASNRDVVAAAYLEASRAPNRDIVISSRGIPERLLTPVVLLDSAPSPRAVLLSEAG